MDDLRERLSSADQWVLLRLCQAGKAWIVGGWVRDTVAGLNPHEVDIATDLRPSQITELFSRTIPVGEAFGTIIVLPDDQIVSDSNNNNISWEVTTLRSEGHYGDGRRPDEVCFGEDILEDLARRDFTINAMAVDASTGELIDPYGGQDDLATGIVRAVGDAKERLTEDGLRIMRAFRFLDAGSMGERHLNNSLSEAIKENRGMLAKISAERKWNELSRVFMGENSASVLNMMAEHGILEVILNGVELSTDSIYSNQPSIDLAIICSSDKRSGVELSSFLKESLRLSNDEAHTIEFLHNLKIEDLEDDSYSTLRRFNTALSESMQKDVASYFGDAGEKYVSKAGAVSTPSAGTEPLIDGKRLIIETGLEPNRRLGRLKGWLHRRQIEDNLATADEVLNLLETIDWGNEDPEKWPSLSWP
ncbi:MAG: CCA tRNA nucleotidyltransferase [Candidatus Thalassarchaeaceae archaeon]|jgi:tRNA nucleotidyltransferase/poly(A) polymerase|nr:CCA tRNA nucleotidyltransferase [Candidatus Thalassarchaeaceae archaeon]MDP6318760.1 CCA tRNA nucleotidyltransferase [Candidatus Thalassarchaeaceae archaeon]DAC34534.1 MAG TPA: CCA tRNA nucleotidyltransferase [Candidatus Poseidoniales archaeon]HIH80379.1 CCA tRNA nucleotidyltransferase [Candidatus Thalassarchaeaceae archaeon]HJM30062.1 CCA tRNA nucleotidyltransferase [Candidatus Thalassarchaeaceae archaeon]|tara:strand:- start:755 stop:2011 length:1257 start_codon:yes stop_codon:yes gene_type:complete